MVINVSALVMSENRYNFRSNIDIGLTVHIDSETISTNKKNRITLRICDEICVLTVIRFIVIIMYFLLNYQYLYFVV